MKEREFCVCLEIFPNVICFWGQNDASAYRGEGVKWRGGGGLVLALHDELTEIFIYDFFEGFY